MTITIVDTEVQRRHCAARYKAHHLHSDGYWHGRADAGTIYERLVALGDNPSWEAIREVSHGDYGPGDMSCDLCGASRLDGDRLTQIVILQEDEYEDSGHYFELCFPCLRALNHHIDGYIEGDRKSVV